MIFNHANCVCASATNRPDEDGNNRVQFNYQIDKQILRVRVDLHRFIYTRGAQTTIRRRKSVEKKTSCKIIGAARYYMGIRRD